MRLFVALDLPPEIKTRLHPLCSGLPGARWVRPEQMHLTLRFIGESDESGFGALKAALSETAAFAFTFTLSLKGVGQFPPRKPPRVLWAGVDAPGELGQLAAGVEKAVTGQGFSPEDKPFSPHITLARLKAPPAPEALRSYFRSHAAFQTDAFPVTAFALYSSRLSPGGAIYKQEAVFQLKRTE